MAKYDLLVKNGCVVDGTGVPRQFADLAIKDGIVERVSGSIAASDAAHVVDAEGKIVAPGVIDLHTHYDAQVHWDPYCTNSSWHGTTTVTVGNCGFGFSPCRADARDRYMAMMENTEQVPIGAMRQALGWDWETFPEWMEHMKRTPKGINLSSYMPLNSLLIFVMGYEAAKSRGANQQERAQMKNLLNQAMDAGAIGFALSHLNEFNTHKDCDGSPMPTDGMQIEDAYYLAEVLRDRDQGLIQCLCEVPGPGENRHVAETLAQISGRPVLHNVVAAFDMMPDYHRGVLSWLDDAEARELNIYSQALAVRVWNEFNVMDYNAWGQIPLFGTLDLAATRPDKVALARSEDYRERARNEYSTEAMVSGGGPVETFILLDARSEKFAPYEGKLLGEIAGAQGAHIMDVFLDLIAESDAHVEFKTSDAISHDPDKIHEILSHKRVLPGTSDGGAHVKFYSGGQYPTDNIMQMVREEGRMSLEEMHYKLSYLPARLAGFSNRGALLEGYAADFYIYDYESLDYNRNAFEVVHDLPDGDYRRVCRSEGVEGVYCNGLPIFINNECTGELPGRLLSNGGVEVDTRLRSPSLKAV